MKREILPVLDTEDKEMMERLLAGGQIKHKYAVRLQAVLNRAKGKGADETAEYLNIHFNTVTQYVRRYNTGGIESLLRDKTRKPGKAPISEEIKNKLCDAVCREKPEHESRRSSRLPAKRFGISHNKTARILRERGIQPHRQTYCSFSTDPNFESKLRDAAGLYLNPPENAVILCADEKTRIQALERTQPVLFPGAKLPPAQTHDYYRHGTAALFAALDMLSGNVIGDCKEHHKTEDYPAFITKLSRECEKGKTLRIIADSYNTHTSQAVKDYIEKHPGRFVLHFTPAHSSWANMIERWFAGLSNKRLRGESWSSVEKLICAVKDYIKYWNKSKRKFQRSKSADTVLSSIDKVKQAYSSV